MKRNGIRTSKEQEKAALTLKLFLLFPVFGLCFWSILQAYPKLGCDMISYKFFLMAWPPNIISLDSLASSTYTQNEQCVYLATCSSISIFLAALAFTVIYIRCFGVKLPHIEGIIPIFSLSLVLIVLAISIPIGDKFSTRGPSMDQPVDVLMIRTSLFIFGLYFIATIWIEAIITYIRAGSPNGA